MSKNTETPRIYVACLASYNAGKLHGCWIDCEGKDADDIQEEVDNMLRASPISHAEEWAIHDYEGFAGIEIGEHESFADVAQHVEMLAAHGEEWAAYVRIVGEHYATGDGFEDAYQGTYSSEEAFAEELAEDTGMLSGVPESIRCYFDFKAFARDLFICDYNYDDETGAVFLNC